MNARFCQVALPLPLRQCFDYTVPEGMPAKVGCRVRVPFGRRALTGVVTELKEKSEVPDPKPLQALLDSEPVLDQGMLTFTRWIADYYLCGWGEALQAALPPLIQRQGGGEEPEPPALPASPAPRLTPAQEKAADAVRQALRAGSGQAFLLCGVTGSGKTEVYLAALAEALRLGGTAVVLVPEIALTPQAQRRFEARFPGQVAVLHSGLPARQRLRAHERLRRGRARVALGARSALFAPLKRLQLIIVDEESEPSYKQESAPRYHARDAALMRAKMEGAVCLLGSATPSFESWANARAGKLRLLSLPSRVGAAGMPSFEFVDLNQVSPGRSAGGEAISPPLRQALQENKAQGGQALLFLNRRGFAPVMACAKCGQAIQCPHCSISLTFHRQEGGRAGAGPAAWLRCHLCGHAARPPQACPEAKCGSRLLRLLGTGTQRLEEELRGLPGNFRVLRADRDAVGRAGSVAFHRELSRKMHAGEVDALVGTQMIAKGLDFPRVTLAAVINADASLNFPDFRAEERTFQLLVQVAGRAGRADRPGRVMVQTRQPEHPCLRAAARQDFAAFYDSRIRERQELEWPPFVRLAALLLKSRDRDKALAAAQDLAHQLDKTSREKGLKGLSVLGPAPAPLVQVKKWWRYRLLCKARDSGTLHRLLDPLVFEWRPKGAQLSVDVDPQNFL